MKKIITFVIAVLIGIAVLISNAVYGQERSSTLPYFSTTKGLGITSPDSLFSMNIRFRMQNRVAIKTNSESDMNISEVEARVRRLRLRFDGFVYSPRLSYVIQFSFTRSDMDYETTSFPNIIRDAYIQYSFTKSFSIGLGQTKLPGNRQRINSSGDLQFADRSIVNATFNIDRDFGLQFTYKKPFYVLRGAISTGDGRNITASNDGLAYSGRFEVLPFGPFTNGGDYYEGDLAREKKPKLAIAVACSQNERVVRTGGQLGFPLYGSTNMTTGIVDMIWKYNGWAVSAEFLNRISPAPVTMNSDGLVRYVYTGHGQNYQASYLFKSNYEIAGKFSRVTPGHEIKDMEKIKEQYALGGSKYIRGHRVKLQGDVTLERSISATSASVAGVWLYRFQIELGI
jgi:phosphate-selective porin OprO and OprP